MSNVLADRVLDSGLNILSSEATDLFICSAQPTTYTEAITTYGLGKKTFGAGAVTSAPGAATPNGRKVTVNAITDGDVTITAGTSQNAVQYAIVDTVNSRLLANGALGASHTVTGGDKFTLPAFDIRMPNQ